MALEYFFGPKSEGWRVREIKVGDENTRKGEIAASAKCGARKRGQRCGKCSGRVSIASETFREE